jgi:hypothetical protein
MRRLVAVHDPSQVGYRVDPIILSEALGSAKAAPFRSSPSAVESEAVMGGRRFHRRWCTGLLLGLGVVGCQHTQPAMMAPPTAAKTASVSKSADSPYGAIAPLDTPVAFKAAPPMTDTSAPTIGPASAMMSYAPVRTVTKPAAYAPASPVHMGVLLTSTPVIANVGVSGGGLATGRHAPDYSWVEGELYYVHSRNSWRLRYGNMGDPDRYGGIVTLLGDGVTSLCREGQIVRVEGTLLDPDTSEPQPGYWVKHIIIVKDLPAMPN